jgi:ferredoxin--NADP+ reductase
VLWAGGAQDDRRLGIEGEELPGVSSARAFVAWYNGHPDHADQEFDLSGERVVIIGNGNVALDVARLLARPASTLAGTDIADHALEALSASGVREIVVASRRGPEHAAYSTGELVELATTEGVALRAQPADVAHLADADDRRSAVLLRAVRREPAEGERSITFRYGLVPVSVDGAGKVESVTFRRADGSLETLPADLVLRAVGYRGHPTAGIPFDELTGTMPHQQGRVEDPETGEPVLGLYCSGWIKRGANGHIGSNKSDSAETVDALLNDFEAGRLNDPSRGAEELAALVASRRPDVVDKQSWLRIDRAERAAGREQGRPRRKFVALSDLLASARPTG